jgi:hypothetical protein
MIRRRSFLSLGLLTLGRAWVNAGLGAPTTEAESLCLPPHPRLLLTDTCLPYPPFAAWSAHGIQVDIPQAGPKGYGKAGEKKWFFRG